jgi:hypothetical protein
MEFTTAFTVIGDDEFPTDDLAKAAPAKVVPIDQVLYEELPGKPWERGELVGEAHGVAVVTHKGVAVYSITFMFGDEDAIMANGVLPVEGSSGGRNHLAVAGGIGRFDKATGRVDVETRNPKRWSFIL